MRFKFSLKNSKIFLRFVWLRCSGLFRWCYVGVSLVFLGVPLVLRGVLSLFRGVSLFRRCPVFRCSVFRRSWFYSMLFNNRLAINNIRKFMISHTTRVSCIVKQTYSNQNYTVMQIFKICFWYHLSSIQRYPINLEAKWIKIKWSS